MKLFKQAFAALAFVASAGTALAAAQPFVPTTAAVYLDMATIEANANGYTVAGSAGAALSAGVLTLNVQGVSNTGNPGPLKIDFIDGQGLQFTKLLNPTISLNNLTFDLATNSLIGDLKIGSGLFGINILNQSLLTATQVYSYFGNEDGAQVSNSSTARELGLEASGFVLSNSFKQFLLENDQDPASYGLVAGLITNVVIGQVPEPSTYALLAVGMVAVGAVARRRRQQGN